MALTAKKVYAILKRQISDMEAQLNHPVRYKGTVSTSDLLPLNPAIGDMYNIESKSIYGEAGMNVAWNGVVWDTMGAPIDMSLYLTKEEAETVIQRLVTEYFEKNPVKPGATTEQAQQIEQNKTDIASLKTETGSLKEDLVVEIKSKNLFNEAKLLQNTRAGTFDRNVSGCISSDWINVQSGASYTISNPSTSPSAFSIGFADDNGNTRAYDKNPQVGGAVNNATVVIPDGFSKIRFGAFSKDNAKKIIGCQLEEGTFATDYVPFVIKKPNDTFFSEYKSAHDAMYNGNGYEVGNILAIKRIEDGKPVEFEYVEEKEYQSADNSMITEHGKNLYNYKNDTFGKYADETGGQTLKLRRSEFIPVEPDTDYFITGSLKKSFNIIFAEFSGNTADSLIQRATILLPNLESNINVNVRGVKITTYSTTKYIRFSTTAVENNDALKDLMIIKGTYGIEYEPYYEFAKYDPLHPANPWRGKRLWVDGDSITHAYTSDFWQFNVAMALDMILDTSVVGLGNEGYADGWKGIGGSTISNEAGKNDPEHSIVLRYMNYPDSGIDLVIIAAGTNDWAHGNTLLGDFDSLDNTTFNGALNILLPALKEKYPTIPVVMMTPIKRGIYKADNTLGLKLEDFVDALIVKCRQYGIYCCDMYANCPIDPNITSMQNVLFTRTSADGSKDLVHPGTEGHKVMGRTVTGFIRSIS